MKSPYQSRIAFSSVDILIVAKLENVSGIGFRAPGVSVGIGTDRY
jgi:hypothetical protein